MQLLAGEWDEDESTPFFALHYGELVDVFGRWLIGVSDGSMWLQCIAVLHEPEARPLIVGWMHIRGTLDGPDIEEFFVWPLYRERGIGTTLAGQGLLYATMTPWQQGRWRWHEPEADATMRVRSQWEPHIPGWLSNLLSDSGGVVASRQQIFSLLAVLANSHSPDGVRMVHRGAENGSTGFDSVSSDDRNQAHGVIIKIHNRH
jgi:hypothetical protein